MNFVKKSVVLQGTLNKDLEYRPFSSSEFTKELSLFCCSNITYKSTQDIDELCTISCNFITSQKLENGQIRSYEQPITSFRLTTSSTKPKGFQNFPVLWFTFNNVSDVLKISLRNQGGQKIDTANQCEISLLLMFQ